MIQFAIGCLVGIGIGFGCAFFGYRLGQLHERQLSGTSYQPDPVPKRRGYDEF